MILEVAVTDGRRQDEAQAGVVVADAGLAACQAMTSGSGTWDTRPGALTTSLGWVAEADFLAEPYRGSDAYVTDGQYMAAMVSTFEGTDLVMAEAPAE